MVFNSNEWQKWSDFEIYICMNYMYKECVLVEEVDEVV